MRPELHGRSSRQGQGCWPTQTSATTTGSRSALVQASEEFTRVRLNQTQLVTSRRPLPEVPATTYAGKRLYLLRHGGKEWLDEIDTRIAVETRMGHEVAGVEGLYSHVTLTVEQEIADSLQTRWLRFVDSEGKVLGKVPSPTALAFDLEELVEKQQVKAAQDISA
ncbi:hypothetical protein SALBM311S_08318 [Streptomyces alboniger]